MKILVGAMLLALTLGAVWEKVDVYRTGYAIEQLRAHKKQIQQEQRALELELADIAPPFQTVRVELINISEIWYVIELPVSHWQSA